MDFHVDKSEIDAQYRVKIRQKEDELITVKEMAKSQE